MTVKRTLAVLLTKAEYIKHDINTKHKLMTEKAKQQWKNDLHNAETHTKVEDGETVMAAKSQIAVDSVQARAQKLSDSGWCLRRWSEL